MVRISDCHANISLNALFLVVRIDDILDILRVLDVDYVPTPGYPEVIHYIVLTLIIELD